MLKFLINTSVLVIKNITNTDVIYFYIGILIYYFKLTQERQFLSLSVRRVYNSEYHKNNGNNPQNIENKRNPTYIRNTVDYRDNNCQRYVIYEVKNKKNQSLI